MSLLKRLLFAALLFTSGEAYAQVVFDYNPPALGSSEATMRNDLNAELDGINTDKVDFVDIDTSAEIAGIVSGETGTGALVFGTAPDLTISSTTETNIEAAIDTLANLTSIQGQTATLSAPLIIPADPNADRIYFWDDSAGGEAWLTPDATLSISTTNIGVVDVTCTGCLGATEIAALDTGDVTTGTFADARIDGSLESDEVKPVESLCLALSDETTSITTGTAKVTWRMPYAFTLTNVRASLNTVSSSGIPTVDINEGTSPATIMTTNKLTIDANELTSVTAATAVGITDTSLADDAHMTADIDVAGTGAKGLKICLIGNRT